MKYETRGSEGEGEGGVEGCILRAASSIFDQVLKDPLEEVSTCGVVMFVHHSKPSHLSPHKTSPSISAFDGSLSLPQLASSRPNNRTAAPNNTATRLTVLQNIAYLLHALPFNNIAPFLTPPPLPRPGPNTQSPPWSTRESGAQLWDNSTIQF